MRYEYKVLRHVDEGELNRLAKEGYHLREVVQACYSGQEYIPPKVIMERIEVGSVRIWGTPPEGRIIVGGEDLP